MRQLTFAARAPQAVGSREQEPAPRESRRLRLLQGGRAEPFMTAREALSLGVFLVNLSKARTRALQLLRQEIAEEEANVVDVTTEEDWRRWEASRENRRWTQRASMPANAVKAFTKDLKEISYALDERFECLSVTDRALSDFVRHYFVYQRKVSRFCEWMAESPVLRNEILVRPYRVEKFKDLATITEMRDVRSIMRQTLQAILRALVAANFSGGNGSHAEVTIKNEMTGESFCCVVEKQRRKETIIAFYPVSQMNRKRQFRTARRLDYHPERRN